MNCVSGQDVVDRIDCIHFKFNMEHQVKGRWGLAIVQPTNPVVSFSSDVIYACLLSTQSPHLLLYFVIFSDCVAFSVFFKSRKPVFSTFYLK